MLLKGLFLYINKMGERRLINEALASLDSISLNSKNILNYNKKGGKYEKSF